MSAVCWFTMDVDGVVSRRSSIIVLQGGKVPTGVYCHSPVSF